MIIFFRCDRNPTAIGFLISASNTKVLQNGAYHELRLFSSFPPWRFFIASESFFRPAAVNPPRRFRPAVLAATFSERLRSAHLLFIASDKRRRPAAVIPPGRRPGLPGFRRPLTTTLASSRRAATALPIRSLSVFNSAMMLLRSNRGSFAGQLTFGLLLGLSSGEYNLPRLALERRVTQQ